MNIDWFTFTAQMINFAVLVYLLHRLLYGPITRAMNQREETVAARLQQADQKKQEAQLAEDRFDELSEQLENQRAKLFEQARAESEETRQSLVTEARTEVESRRDDWLKSLGREQATLINLVRQRASQQVVDVSSNVLVQLADEELEEKTLTTFLKLLGYLPDAQVDRLKEEASKGNQARIHTAFDVSNPWQQRIEEALRRELSLDQVTFVTSPELICGVELHLGGVKIGWSMQEYFESLKEEMQGLFTSDS